MKNRRHRSGNYFLSRDEIRTLSEVCWGRNLREICDMMVEKGYPKRSRQSYINQMHKNGWEWDRTRTRSMVGPELELFKKCYENGLKLNDIVKVLVRAGFPCRNKACLSVSASNRGFKRQRKDI